MSGEADGIAKVLPRLQARIAGFLYLLIILGALFIPFHVAPSGISGMTLGEAATPAFIDRLLASKPLYVLSGAGQLMVLVCDIGVAWLFYELLKPVDGGKALLAAFFRLVFVAIAGANVFNHFAPLVLLSGADYLSALSSQQLRALALAFLKFRTIGFDIALVFFGFHCILIGYLLFKSTFFPRILGLLLAIGGLGYLANILVHAIPPAVRENLFPYVMLPAVAEILLTVWLIIVGVNAAKWKAQAAAER